MPIIGSYGSDLCYLQNWVLQVHSAHFTLAKQAENPGSKDSPHFVRPTVCKSSLMTKQDHSSVRFIGQNLNRSVVDVGLWEKSIPSM